MPDFLPRGDAALLAWSANFVDAVRPAARAAGLESCEADMTDTLHRAFVEAYVLANAPGTRTSVAVRLKDDCRAALVRHLRGLAGRVRAQRTTTSEHCIAMDIRPTRTGKGRLIPRPTVRPQIAVIEQSGARVTLLVLDAATKRSRAPQKAMGAMLYVAHGEQYPANEKAWQFVRRVAAGRQTITFAADLPPGTRVWIAACWISPTGQEGMRCTPATTRLAGGETGLAA